MAEQLIPAKMLDAAIEAITGAAMQCEVPIAAFVSKAFAQAALEAAGVPALLAERDGLREGRMSIEEIIKEMKVWYDGSYAPGKDRRAASVERRTEQQKDWDAAILAAAEFVRRLDGYDETRALAIHELLSTKLPKD